MMILITDAPCHGAKYHNKVNDYYPEETIEDALDIIIEKDINFLSLQINPRTLVMNQVFEEYFNSQEKP
jgi:myosin protein heavy chain